MAQTRAFTLYSGSDSVPVEDFTTDTDWQQTELTSMANVGDAGAGQWVLRDEGGLMPDYVLPTKFIAGHNVVVVQVGSNTLFRGRVASQDTFRGRQKVARAVEKNITLEDNNSQLRGIVVHNWVRPAETDAARAQALVAAYLSGSPRVTTNLNGSNLVITSSNTVSLPAKTYSGVTPYSIMQELASNADKEAFVTIDDELAYFGHDYTGYAASLRISDAIADANATTYAPIDPRTTENGRALTTALRIYYGTDQVNQTFQLTSPWFTPIYDYWEDTFYDSESVNSTQAAARGRAELNYRGQDDTTYTCQIGPLTGDDIWRIKPGHQIQFKSRAAIAGRSAGGAFFGDSFRTTRVREVRWTMPAEDIYFATLQLERPRAIRTYNPGTKPTAQPAPTADPGTPEGATLYKFYDADDGGDAINWTGILSNQSPGGAEGSTYYYFKSSAPNRGQDSWAATAGTIYRFTGYTHLASGKTLSVAWRSDAAGSSGTLPAPTLISEDVLVSGPTSKWTAFSTDVTAPVGTTSASLAKYGSTTSLDFDRVRIYTITPGSPSSTTDPNALDDPGTSPYYARSDDPRFTADDEHLISRTVRHMVNNSGVTLADGDVVIGDQTLDNAVTRTTTAAYAADEVGVVLDGGANGATVAVLWSGVGNIPVSLTGTPAAGDYLFASATAGKADVSATLAAGAFGRIIKIDASNIPTTIEWWGLPSGGTSSGGSVTVADVIATHRFPLSAHRGDIGSADSFPEDSMQAERQAALKGCEIVAWDAVQSSDGTFWGSHDTTVDRTTNGSGAISGKTDATLATYHYDAGYGYDAGRHGSSIPLCTLQQMLDAIEQYGCILSIELKGGSPADLATALIAAGWGARTIIEVSTLADAATVKGVDASLTVLVNQSVAGSATNANVDWLSWDISTMTNLAATQAKAPKVIKAYEAIGNYGVDETTDFANVYAWGARSFQTQNLDAALVLRQRLGYDFANPMTAIGDLIRGGTAGVSTRLAIGSSNTHLVSDGAVPVWTPNTDFISKTLIDAKGDLILGTTNDNPGRLAIGASNTHLTSDGTTALWFPNTGGSGSLTDHDHTAPGDGGDLTGSVVSNYLDFTEQGSAPSAPAGGMVRLFGSNTYLYQEDSGGGVMRLSGSGSGFANPMTTTGDIIRGGTSGAATRVAIGASNTHLVSDGTIPVWVANSPFILSGAHLSNSGTQSRASNSALVFDTEEYDTDAYHSTSVNTSRLTLPASGYYHVGAFLKSNGTITAGKYIAFLQKNSADLPGAQQDSAATAGGGIQLTVVADFQGVGGDFIEVKINAAGTITMDTACRFWIHRIG